jgi:hypothetical protein
VHAGEGGPPPRLQRAFTAKKIQAEAVCDVFGALARLCGLAKDSSVTLPILAIVEPERIRHAADLFEAASVYAPKAVLWVYSSEPHEQIREVRESDLVAWRAAQDEPGAQGGRTDELELPDPRAEESENRADAGSRPPGGSILTEEELEMLLADDVPDDTLDQTPGDDDRTP